MQQVPLQIRRFRKISEVLEELGVSSVCDGGCGEGDGGIYWSTPDVRGWCVRNLVCVDRSPDTLATARAAWEAEMDSRSRDCYSLQDHSMPKKRWASKQGPVQVMGIASNLAEYDSLLHHHLARNGVEAMVLCEVVEHCPLDIAARLIHVSLSPQAYGLPHLVMTTPDKSFNAAYGLEPWEMRHWDHKWEMTHEEFRVFVTDALSGLRKEGLECDASFFSVGTSQGVVVSAVGPASVPQGRVGRHVVPGGERGSQAAESAVAWRVTVSATSEVEFCLWWVRDELVRLEAESNWVPLEGVVRSAVEFAAKHVDISIPVARLVQLVLEDPRFDHSCDSDVAYAWVRSCPHCGAHTISCPICDPCTDSDW